MPINNLVNTAGLISYVNVSAPGSSNNLSKVVFTNANGVTFGLDGSTVTASASYFSFGFYTLTNGTLTLVNSCSSSFGAGAATNNSTLYAGLPWLTLGTAGWSSSPAFSADVQY